MKTNNETHRTLKVGDKIILPSSYRGEAIPELEWTVVKENAKSFIVHAVVNAGKPNWMSLNLYLNKSTWRITA